MTILTGTVRHGHLRRAPGVTAAVALATLAFLTIHAAGGFASLRDAGVDNDSSLRLVEIRDLIAGQSWFDLRQTRLGLDGGIVMHWSRLVDAPIAALVLAVKSLTGSQAMGEAAALVLWPLGLFAASLALIATIATRRFGAAALLPATVIGGAALHYTGVFAPGAIDHHNLQLTLVLAVLFSIARSEPAMTSRRNGLRWALLAGVLAAAILAIAMEGAPYVAAAGTVVALLWLSQPIPFRDLATGFGFGFGAAALTLFVATVRPGMWSGVQCDAYSFPQVSLAAIAGLGLAVVAGSRLGRGRFAFRLAALAGLGVALAGLAVLAFPACLADPYAQLDPRLRDWWLDAVTEAQPVWSMLRLDPATAAGQYGVPLLGLIAALRQLRTGPGPGAWAGFALLAGAIAVSLWQVRGAVFAAPLAAIPLAGFVTERRLAATAAPSSGASVAMALAWLVSFSVVWSTAAGLLAPRDDGPAVVHDSSESCTAADAFRQLDALAPARIAAVSNLGSPILRYTHHAALAGPYHRNVAGNLAALDIFTSTPAGARAFMQRSGATLLALCRGNGESRFLAGKAQEGLLAALLRDAVPVWLQVLPETRGKPIEIYRLVDPAAT